MLVTVNGKQIKIPAFVISQQASHVKKIYSAVNKLVPKTIWKRLNILRGKYIREYQREQ